MNLGNDHSGDGVSVTVPTETQKLQVLLNLVTLLSYLKMLSSVLTGWIVKLQTHY